MTEGPTGQSAVLVLGGRGEIGAAIAQRFSSAGRSVVVTGRAEMDLTDPVAIDRWFSGQRPQVETLVHCAGLNNPKKFVDLSHQEIAECFAVNVDGFLRVTRHALPDLVEARGRIVVVSSIFGFLARVGRLPYVMSKHALVGIVKSLALELAPSGVLVNAVSPGYIDTRLTRANNDDATISRLIRAIPVGDLGRPDDVAEVAYFLASPANSYVTGQDIVVDGGFSIDGGRD